ADVDARHRRAELRQAERILPRVALQVDQPPPRDIAEQFHLLREEGRTTLAQEPGLVGLVAVVRHRRRIPGDPVVLVQLLAQHQASPRVQAWLAASAVSERPGFGATSPPRRSKCPSARTAPPRPRARPRPAAPAPPAAPL